MFGDTDGGDAAVGESVAEGLTAWKDVDNAGSVLSGMDELAEAFECILLAT